MTKDVCDFDPAFLNHLRVSIEQQKQDFCTKRISAKEAKIKDDHLTKKPIAFRHNDNV